MQYVRLGNTGLEVSRICLGCMGYGDASRGIHPWVLNEEQSRPIFRKALELGINFFDTANVYSVGTSEEISGARSRSWRTGMKWSSRRRCFSVCMKGRTARDCPARRS